MSTASLMKEMSGESLSVIDSIHSINKAILCSRSNDANCIREEILNTLDKQVKTYLTYT
jgi:hypothetical protein